MREHFPFLFSWKVIPGVLVVALGVLYWQGASAARTPVALHVSGGTSATSLPQLQVRSTLGTRIHSLLFHEQPVVTTIALADSAGVRTDVPVNAATAMVNSSSSYTLPQPVNFRPGKYQATVTTRQGSTVRTTTQDFSWGVLAVNTPSAIVRPGDTVPLHLAVLDDQGAMVCDAQVAVTVTSPRGQTVYAATRGAEEHPNTVPVAVHEACAKKARTTVPDYETAVRPLTPGRYTVHVKAVTRNGVRELDDAFLVAETLPYTIKREGFPTRVFPAATYPVVLQVTPTADFTGVISDSVPASFTISNISHDGVLLARDVTQHIRWTGTWKAGTTYSLGYTFDAPDTTPAFFTFGPALIGAHSEGRPWQLAIDGTEQFIAFTDGAVPSGWTCVSCTAGDPFYQLFPRGNTTYGGTGGSTTHTHTLNLVSTLNNGTSTVSNSTGAVDYAAPDAEHPTVSSTSVTTVSSIPAYRDLKVIRYNQTGNPSTLPSGIIAMFDSAPSGSWTRYTNQDGKFLYGENDATTTGGSDTETHDFSGTLDADPSGFAITINGGSNSAPAGATVFHTHTFSGTTASTNHVPANVHVLLYQATATVPTPPGILGMWSNTPPSGWTSLSGVGGDFNQKYLSGSSTYATAQGAATHTPANTTVTSSSLSSGSQNRRTTTPTTTISAATHTHQVVVGFSATDSAPPYRDAIIAKKDVAVSATISGTLYSDEGTTPINCASANKTVTVEVNGVSAYSGTCTASGGTYSIGSVSISAGDIVTVWISGASEKATTVTRASNASISGFDLYQNRLIVRHEDNGPISNTDLGEYDSDNDADIVFSSNSNALSVASGSELHVWTGMTFTPGGSVTTTASSSASSAGGDVHIAASATLSMETNALSIGGDYTNAGTFSKSTGQTTTFTATATGFSITPGTGNFDSLTFNGSGGGWSPSAALSVDVDLTLTAGTLSGTQNVTVNGSVAGTAGIIALTGGTFEQRVAAAKSFGTTSGSAAWSFSSLTFSNSSGSSRTVTTSSGGTGSVTVAGTLTIGKGTDTAATVLDAANRTWILSGSGTPLSIATSPAATFTTSTSTIRFAGTSATTIPLTFTYYGLELRPSGAGSPNYTLGTASSQTLTVSSNFTIGDGTNAVTVKADTYNPAVIVAGNITLNSGITYTKGTGAFTFNGTTATTYTDNTTSPQNLGDVTFNKTNSSSPSTNDKVTLGSSLTADTVTINGTSGQEDTLDLGSSGYTLKLANVGSTATVLTVSGTLTIGTSTVEFAATNSGGNVTVPVLAYSTLKVSGAETYVLAGNQTSGNAITGSVTIGSGAILDVTASNYDMTVAKNWTNSGTFTARAGTVTLNGSTAQTVTTGGDAFSSLTIANTGTAGTSNDDVIISGTLTVGGTLTVTSGELKLSTNNPNVNTAGNVVIGASGKVTKGTGTWTFNGTTTTTYTDSTATPQNIGDVVITKTNGTPSNNKLTLASSITVDTMTVSASNTLDLGSSGYTLKLANAGSTATVLTVSGTLTIGTSTIEFAATNSGGNVTVPVLAYSTLTLSGSETYTLDSAGSIGATLTVGSASTLSVSGSSTFAVGTATIAGTATFASTTTVSGDLSITGSFTAPAGTLTLNAGYNNDGSFTHSDGTVVFAATSGTQAVDAAGTGSSSFNNLTFSGSAQWNLDTAVSVDGTFTQASGTILAPLTTLTIAGDFAHTGGTYTANGGTVDLTGGDQTISGETTFYSLKKSVAVAHTLTFPAGSTQTVTGTLTLNGALNASLSLRSSSTGTQWKFDPQGTRDLDFLDVEDSNNVNARKVSTAGITVFDSGNNTGWTFAPRAPSGLSGTAVSSTSITWTWVDLSSDEDGFRLETSSGAILATIAHSNTTTYTETGLTRNTTYTRKVVSYSENGDSAGSPTGEATTNASAPTPGLLTSPANTALLNTLTPTFIFSRSTDDDDGMGTYRLLVTNPAKKTSVIDLGEAASGSSVNVGTTATVVGKTSSITVTLKDNTLLEEGENTWKVESTDSAGNVANSPVSIFRIDITKPLTGTVGVAPVADVTLSGEDFVTSDQQPTLTAAGTDDYKLGSVTFELDRRQLLFGEEVGATKYVSATKLLQGKSDTATWKPDVALPFASYRIKVTIEDAAGNTNTTQRLLALLSPQELAQHATPGTTTSEQREQNIDQGKQPSKTPTDFTLPSLEKFAQERRTLEAQNLMTFLQRFFPLSWLQRFELALSRAVLGIRGQIVQLAQRGGTKFASLFGFTADQLQKLRELAQRCSTPACTGGAQQVANTPIGTALNRALPRFAAKVFVAIRSGKEHAFSFLVQARKNRSHLATQNEHLLTRYAQPIVRTTHWIGVGTRIALEGIRGQYENPLQISDVAIGTTSLTSVSISWKTNHPTIGKINFGPSISYGHEARVDDYASSHTVTLTDLQPNTKYFFEVLAHDMQNRETFDAYYGFTTAQ